MVKLKISEINLADYIDSETVAADLGIQHKSLCQVIGNKMPEAISKSINRTNGRPKRVYYLTQKQLDIISTYSGRKSSCSHFYIAVNTENNRYKIGVSCNIKKRIACLNTQSGCDVQPVFSCKSDNCRTIENNIKQKYRDYNVKGEWYNFTDQQVEEIINEAIFIA